MRLNLVPSVYKGIHWVLEHAYDTSVAGWLVLITRRHVRALHELTDEEFAELGSITAVLCRALHDVTGCVKEYVAVFAEAPEFHLHVHFVPRANDWPSELKGPKSFAALGAADVVTVDQMSAIAGPLGEKLREALSEI